MPPKVKKTHWDEPKPPYDTVNEEKPLENEKENKSPELEQKRRRRNIRNIANVYFEETESDESRKSVMLKSNTKLKPLGFWSKKVKDLEENQKNKKYELYEFSGTDESEFSYKKKKRPKQKTKLKKKQPAISKHCQIITKTKKNHAQSFCRGQTVSNKGRKKLAERGKKFTFSTGISSFGITSTPQVNKNNLVGSSNFLFLSPISKEVECSSNGESLMGESVVNKKEVSVLHSQTPKVETKLKRISCRRVLRSGKMLNT